MASTTNATTVLYGTAWSDDTLLAIERAKNLEYEERMGIQRHFEHDWRTLAAINPKYKKFVESEIARLGEEHITIRTQYRLLPISGAGFLLSDLQRYLLRGTHHWEAEPDEEEDGAYIAGMDVGGEDRPKPQYISLKDLLRQTRSQWIKQVDKVKKLLIGLKGFGGRHISPATGLCLL
jgi:hypothetical protein